MLRSIFLLFLFCTLSLVGCAKSIDSTNKSANTLSPYEDPDGDGDNKGANYFKLQGPNVGHKVFIFDPKKGAWAAYDMTGKRVNTGRASGGSTYCPDIDRPCETIVGTFQVTSKGNADCTSSEYPIETNGGAPMPYCMHFGSGGYAIHGSNSVPNHNASHGCIRVTPLAAKWLNHQFINIGTTVIVLPYHQDDSIGAEDKFIKVD